MDVVSRLKRQRAWIFLGTVASMTAVIAVVRIFNPSPLPLRFVSDFWVVAVVVIAIIIQTFYLQSVRMATELEKANTSLRAEIAERQQVESALQKSEQRYRELFENAGDMIVILTLDGTVTDVNRGAEVLVGRLREETIGRHFNDFLTPAANTQMEERFRRFYAGEEVPSVFEIELVHKNGGVVPAEVRARFIRDAEGNLTGIQTIHRDISARRALEQQRADFLAMLTHDIRNPLGVILGYTEMLREKAREQDAHWEADVLSRIESSALTVHSLVTNYLDLSKIEAGQLTLTKQAVVINDVLSRVGRQYESESRRQRLTLELHLQQGLPPITGDPGALERVFANLLHNGLKFTPQQGRVTVTSARQNGEVVAAIRDTGSGMAAAEIPTLFEKYRQAEHPKRSQGTGLGLFIVKMLVEAHGGRIEVESTPGVGTCFSVFFPMTTPGGPQGG
ncbi:MAG TPA: PAS domain-containing sensor histidine kinase [Candidatus Binatia bacterium]|nr:PAS domain-containing sensor histidine kinase [Candidatus Binatia bacterium]